MKDNLCMPAPANAVNVTDIVRSDTDQTLVARICEMPDGTFIGQDAHSSLGFPTYEAAIHFIATFNK